MPELIVGRRTRPLLARLGWLAETATGGVFDSFSQRGGRDRGRVVLRGVAPGRGR